MKAFTRAVSPQLPDCALTHLDRTPIDVAKATAQHAAYEQALADAGLELIRLPELRTILTPSSSRTRRCCSTAMR